MSVDKTELQILSESVTNVRLDIRELMTEVRGLKDLQNAVNNHESRIIKTEESTASIWKRIDKFDKIIWFLFTTTFGSLGTAIWSLIIKK